MPIQERLDPLLTTNWNQTVIGTMRDGTGPGILGVNAPTGVAGTAGSCLILLSPDGTERALWVQNDGKLYIGTRAQFLAQAGGTIVGTQF